MRTDESFLLPERCSVAVAGLAEWATAAFQTSADPATQRRVRFVLTDLVGVTVAGMRTPEMRRLLEVWSRPAGSAPLIGTTETCDPETSAFLAAVAACMLELDEGNKHAAGHPAAHVVFTAVAAAQLSPEAISGPQLMTAIAVGYEVAARFGRATTTATGWHPHGHWGATGAAAAAALLLGAGPAQVAAAIDSSTGLMQVTPWGTVLSGDFTRNLWIAGAGGAGLRAARLAIAGLAENVGNAHHSLGGLVGHLDLDALGAGLRAEPLLITQGYLKQHASCSYTHSAVDLVASLRAAHPWHEDDVTTVRVRTHSLARPLLARHPRTRLAAMFSLPFVVANAVVNGRVDPSTMQPGTPEFLAADAFSERVEIEIDADLDAHLPERRITEVVLGLHDGSTLGLAQPNPVGDADHFPLDDVALREKMQALIGAKAAADVEDAVSAIAASDDVVRALALLHRVGGPRD